MRKVMVLFLILVWMTVGVYSTVCSSLCATADYAEHAAPASLTAPLHAKLARSGETSEPSHPADYCVSSLHARKCVTGLFQTPRVELSYAQTLLTASVAVAPAVQGRAGLHAVSPPRLISAHLISQKHPLLRI